MYRPPALGSHFATSLIDGAASVQFYSFAFQDFITRFLFLSAIAAPTTSTYFTECSLASIVLFFLLSSFTFMFAFENGLRL
jgi:hypothetical protein